MKRLMWVLFPCEKSRYAIALGVGQVRADLDIVVYRARPQLGRNQDMRDEGCIVPCRAVLSIGPPFLHFFIKFFENKILINKQSTENLNDCLLYGKDFRFQSLPQLTSTIDRS